MATERDELRGLSDRALSDVELAMSWVQDIERKVSSLSVSAGLGEAWSLRDGLADFAMMLAETRGRVAGALRAERDRRADEEERRVKANR